MDLTAYYIFQGEARRQAEAGAKVIAGDGAGGGEEERCGVKDDGMEERGVED